MKNLENKPVNSNKSGFCGSMATDFTRAKRKSPYPPQKAYVNRHKNYLSAKQTITTRKIQK
jgi:hypothetical protein